MNTAKEPLDGYDPFAGFRAEHEGNKQDTPRLIAQCVIWASN